MKKMHLISIDLGTILTLTSIVATGCGGKTIEEESSKVNAVYSGSSLPQEQAQEQDQGANGENPGNDSDYPNGQFGSNTPTHPSSESPVPQGEIDNFDVFKKMTFFTLDEGGAPAQELIGFTKSKIDKDGIPEDGKEETVGGDGGEYLITFNENEYNKLLIPAYEASLGDKWTLIPYNQMNPIIKLQIIHDYNKVNSKISTSLYGNLKDEEFWKFKTSPKKTKFVAQCDFNQDKKIYSHEQCSFEKTTQTFFEFKKIDEGIVDYEKASYMQNVTFEHQGCSAFLKMMAAISQKQLAKCGEVGFVLNKLADKKALFPQDYEHVKRLERKQTLEVVRKK